MKKALFIVIPLAIGGVVVGLAFLGMINIPGITPQKKVAKKQEAQAPPASKETIPGPAPTTGAPVAKKQPEPETDPEKGHKKLANLWMEVPTEDLAKIVAAWKDEDLAPVLSKMDPGKVAEVLVKLGDKRASRISREIQRLASLKV
jgi:hypothetical protein